MEENEFAFADVGKLTIASEYQHSPRNVTFMNEDNEVIGKLSWEDDVFKFEGEAEESAQIFFDCVLSLMFKSKTE